jgi:class 3 adenylate cyclase
VSGKAMAQSLESLGAKIAEWPGGPRTVLEIRIRWLLTLAVMGSNAAGGLVTLFFVTWAIPDPPGIPHMGHIKLVNIVAYFSYPLLAGPVALAWGHRLLEPVKRLVREGGVPDQEQRRAVLLGPAHLVMVLAVLWAVGTAGWTLLNLHYSGLLALKIALVSLLGAITTCATVYLRAELLLRPAAALVLATGPASRSARFGVTARSMIAWALGSAVPVLGLIALAVAALAVKGMDTAHLAIASLCLGAWALAIGFQVAYISARAIGDPIHAVREAMARVERGDLDAAVEVYDATELGLLQTGFNNMMAGLRDHERLRDLFGRHVGEDVADLALQQDIELGGEVRDVAVLFVDLAGSTHLASTRPPDEVVGLLNAFFGVVVDVVTHHDGWINKFEGDAALAIFGAPVELPEAATRALAAARDLGVRLAADLPEITAGIGVSAGPVVAGYIGAEKRFEYTVIGDPVNEAARLSDLAKAASNGVLAAATLLDTADEAEAIRWEPGKSVILRGRSRPTRLAVPRQSTPVVPPVVPPQHRPRRFPKALRPLTVFTLLTARPRPPDDGPTTP